MFCLLKLKCLFSLCYLFPSTRLLFFVFPVLPHFFLSPCAFPWVQCCRTKSSRFGRVPRVKWAYEVTCEFEHEVLCLGSVPRARLRETELGLPQSRITRGSCFPSAHFTRCLSRVFFFFPLWVPRAASVCSPWPASTEIPGDPVLRRGVSRPPEAEEAHHGSCEFPVTSLSSHTSWSGPF